MGGGPREHRSVTALGRLPVRLVRPGWGGSGVGSVRAEGTGDGGSRVHAEWTYTGVTRARDKVVLALIPRFPIRTFIAREWKQALDRYAVESSG